MQTKREWKVGVRAESYYDNNISRSSSLLTSQRNLSKDDYVLLPAVTATLVQPFGRQSVFLNGDVGYAFHRYNDELNRRRAKVSGGVGGILGPCRPVLFGSYQAAQSDLANLDVGTTKNLQQVFATGVGAQCARSSGPGASFMVQRSDVKNSALRVKESDTTTEVANVQLLYSRPTLGTFSAGFGYSSSEFPNRIIPGRPVGDGFFTQSYFVGYSRKIGQRLTVSGQGGLTHLKREFSPAGVDQSFNSKTYSADVTYGLGERIEFEVRGSRNITPSQQVGKTFDKTTKADALVRYKAGDRLSLEGGYSWQKINSNADTASALLVVTDAETDAIYGNVSFSPNDRLSLSLNVRYEERDANLPQFTYTATRIGVSAQTSF
ncbi:hypothetical protein [Phenylobacterium sp.]|uniref:hypothetical protein n=1 Tax=Phenylobacterium sp. TaxID=1871053 RepID=UPI003D278953